MLENEDVGAIKEGCDLVYLVSWSEGTVPSGSRGGADKIHAGNLVLAVETVISWDINGPAIRVKQLRC